MNRRVIHPGDVEWPRYLTEMGTVTPPDELHVEGAPLRLDRRTVAIVGTRHPTAAGVEAAEQITRGLVEAGFAIVSGLAVGIDAVAHRTALDAGGYTVAVLGCGLDFNYPARNSSLRRRIARQGTVVTEYEDGIPPSPQNFPKRNRIIAGLSAGVVYVEGGSKSGGKITVRHALDADRCVFAVPGSIRNPLAAGPNELIRTSQAALVSDVKHICDELAPGLVWNEGAGVAQRPQPPKLDRAESDVLCFLDDVPVSDERISAALGLSPGEVALALARLEVRGWVVRRLSGYAITSGGARVRNAYASLIEG